MDLIRLEEGEDRQGRARGDPARPRMPRATTAARRPGTCGRATGAGALPGAHGRAASTTAPSASWGVIAPWNFALILGITDALPALGGGLRLSSSSSTPARPTAPSGPRRLLEDGGSPTGATGCSSPAAASSSGPPLIDRVDYVMFTGSTRVGREVATRCAERLIGCSLELGGKNAMLVLDDADVGRGSGGRAQGLVLARRPDVRRDGAHLRARGRLRGVRAAARRGSPRGCASAPGPARLRDGVAPVAAAARDGRGSMSRTPSRRARTSSRAAAARPDVGPLLLRADRPRRR